MLAVIMLVVLLSGCGARRGAADVSATKSAQIVEETDVSGHAQRYGGDSDKSSSEATVNGLLSFSELSEIPDGSYWIRVSMTGGSGRASISSPTGFYVKDGQATADIHWSSASYDYMKLDGARYEAFTDAAGHSAMTIPVSALDTAIPVLADTTAMSKPYEIEYQLTFDGSALLPMTNGQSGMSTRTAGSSGTTDADGSVLWSAAPEIDGITFVSSEKNNVAEYFRLSIYEDASGVKYQLLETAGGLRRYLIVPAEVQISGKSSVSAESEASSKAGSEANHGGKKSAKSGTTAEPRFTARSSEANSANKEKKGDALELTVLQQPLTTTYVAASAVMAPLCDLGAVRQIRFSGLREEGWYVDEARAAMKEGTMLFAGKYSEPDYETLLREGCDLALESTMIYRAPEVTEKLNALGIPVYIDYSSYEPHVLGRLEWVRVYGALFGHEERAQQWYASESDRIRAIQKDAEKASVGAAQIGKSTEKSGTKTSVDSKNKTSSTKTGSESAGQDATAVQRPTVVYFYVNASGQIQVRQPNDYIPELLELAGARYLAPDMSGLGGSRKSNVTVSLEDFYSSCRDADYLIYSATLDRPLSSIQELLGKNALFADFKAVKEGHVYTTDKDFYQLSDRMADFAEDVSRMLQGQGDMHFLKQVL